MLHVPAFAQTATPVSPIAASAPADFVEMFGLRIANTSGECALAQLLAPGRRRVHFVNAHCINVMSRDPSYAQALDGADVILPDGAGIELAMRMRGARLVENLNGTDFVPRLARAAAVAGRSVFLFGARPGTAEAAAEALARLAPGLRIAGTRDGFAGAGDPDAAIRAINASGADILLVAMGVPLQDVWLAENADRLTPSLCLGVGACFDFLAGNVSRAPAALRRSRLEWAWRLMKEPRRMAARYLVGNLTFTARAAVDAVRSWRRDDIARRAMDIAVSGAALLALSPVLLAAAAAVRLTSPGPVLFRQTRVGQDGRPFQMLKFRSMYADAEARRAAVLATSDRAGLCFKSRHDPRITPVGRILRRFSIDEMPQILNVLKGDMSVVGPRPALPSEVAAYPAPARGRLAVRPGITGVWQVAGRAEIGFDKMVDMDLAYVRSRSILLDLLLIALTFRAVLSGRGAY